jgi:hypothetical protein
MVRVVARAALHVALRSTDPLDDGCDLRSGSDEVPSDEERPMKNPR